MPNEISSTLKDYEHWNEEAAIIKAQEDRWADYWQEPDYGDPWDDYGDFE